MSNPNFIDQELHDEYANLFKGKSEAWDFLRVSCEFYETIDDEVDEEKELERQRKLAALAGIVYNHPYWDKYKGALWLVDRIIHAQYFDSAEWEKSEEEWKKRDAKALSHAAVNMVFAVILLEHGQQTLDKFSSKFREHAHRLHLKDINL